MKRPDWITIISVLLTTIGSIVHTSYKIGGLTERVTSLEKNTEKEIAEIKTDIREMKSDISDIRVDMAEMKVKVDELWRDHQPQTKSSKARQKGVSSHMSQAFVREGDHQDLQDISPTVTALVSFLTNENGGIRVYEKKKVKDNKGEIVHMMSNGLGYKVNEKGKWEIV